MEIFAREFAKVICIDPWQASTFTESAAGYDPLHVEAEFDMRSRAVRAAVSKLKMSSREAAALLDGARFPFIYIDALHEYEHVRADILLWLPRLRDGGTIALHDYNLP